MIPSTNTAHPERADGEEEQSDSDSRGQRRAAHRVQTLICWNRPGMQNVPSAGMKLITV